MQSPEERELEVKRAELELLQSELAQCELDLVTSRTELSSFESRYMRIVGMLFVELDQIEARIAEARAEKNSKVVADTEDAPGAKRRAQESEEAMDQYQFAEPSRNPPTSEDLKQLYREAAKRVHPDLSIDEPTRKRRTTIMAEVNEAYANGDSARIKAIISDWDARPEAVSGDDIGAQLIRYIRKIAQGKGRLDAIKAELEALHAGDIWQMKVRADQVAAGGQDLLKQMAQYLLERIRSRREYLLQFMD
jgi:hypothetical protein